MPEGSSTVRVGVLVLAVLVGLSGCSLDVQGSVEPAPPAGARGGSAVIGIPRPGSIDPGNAYEPVGTMVAGALCDTLLDVDRRTGELVPALAESWQVTGDGEAVIVRLRDDVRFHDGTELTAEDVVYSLSRAASAEFAGDAADLLEPIVGFEAIRGQVPDAPQRLRDRLAGVQSLTTHTVQIAFKDLQAGTVALLTHPVTAPVSRQAAEDDPEAFRSRPVCAGPYRLATAWEPEDRVIRLERFDDYHARHAAYTGGGAGYLDEIELRIVSGLGPTRAADPAPSPSVAPTASDGATAPEVEPEVAPPSLEGLDAAFVAAGRAEDVAADPELTLVQTAGPGIEYVGLPFSEPQRDAPRDVGTGTEAPDAPTDQETDGADTPGDGDPDTVLRRALSQALDREAIATEVFGGGRLPATGFLPSTLGTDWSRTSPCGPWIPEDGDSDAARRLLDEAGISLQGRDLEFTFNDELRNRALVEAVAGQWEAAFDVQVTLTALSWEEYLTRGGQVGGFPGPFRFSWSVPYPDADRYLHPLFHTSGIGTTNLSGYSSATFDELIIEDARRAAQPEDRALLYHQAEDLLCEDLPLIPVLQERQSYAVRTDRLATADGEYAGGPRGELLLREVYLSE